jgi:hypothetical protein
LGEVGMPFLREGLTVCPGSLVALLGTQGVRPKAAISED